MAHVLRDLMAAATGATTSVAGPGTLFSAGQRANFLSRSLDSSTSALAAAEAAQAVPLDPPGSLAALLDDEDDGGGGGGGELLTMTARAGSKLPSSHSAPESLDQLDVDDRPEGGAQ